MFVFNKQNCYKMPNMYLISFLKLYFTIIDYFHENKIKQ